MKKWRLINSGLARAPWNMAVDEAIMMAVGEGKAPPTLRFYGWEPAALSIGYFQQVRRTINMDAVARTGVELVRRPTGGRAVFHDREITYSMIIPEDDERIPGSIQAAYRWLSEGLLLGLRRIGIDAQMTRVHEKRSVSDSSDVQSAACFDAPAFYELTVDGRKIAGSAQMRQRGVLLQHGSIPLEFDVDFLVGLLYSDGAAHARMLQKKLAASAISVNQWLRQRNLSTWSVNDLQVVFTQAWAEAMQLEFTEQPLSEYESELARTLAANKYDTAEWTMKK